MYKEMIVSIVIVIAIFLSDYLIQNYAKKSVENIRQDLQEVRQGLEQRNLEQAEEKIKKTENDWDNIKDKIACYIEHNELNKVETNFTLSKSLARLENYDLALSKLDETIFVLEHINERYVLSLENIF